jgi:hypothetical protein
MKCLFIAKYLGGNNEEKNPYDDYCFGHVRFRRYLYITN